MDAFFERGHRCTLLQDVRTFYQEQMRKGSVRSSDHTDSVAAQAFWEKAGEIAGGDNWISWLCGSEQEGSLAANMGLGERTWRKW